MNDKIKCTIILDNHKYIYRKKKVLFFHPSTFHYLPRSHTSFIHVFFSFPLISTTTLPRPSSTSFHFHPLHLTVPFHFPFLLLLQLPRLWSPHIFSISFYCHPLSLITSFLIPLLLLLPPASPPFHGPLSSTATTLTLTATFPPSQRLPTLPGPA